MDKVKDLFDKINALIADFNMEREHGALLLLGEDFHNVCGNYQGKISNIIKMLSTRMDFDENLKIIVLEAARIFLEKQEPIKSKIEKEKQS